jgi:predicted dehydrogenase
MKQVVQSVKTGKTDLAEVPVPNLRARGILVQTCASLLSAGTERMVVDFANKNLFEKAKARPDLARQVFDKAQTEGILTTLESVRNRLDQPLALGYSSAGVVIKVGGDAGMFKVGDRVACAGGGHAAHAEIASVPRNLAALVPENVELEEACFATMGAIALQGVRQGEIALGHQVAIIGLGLLGQLAIQIVKAAGCRVFGVDLNPSRVSLALEMGADEACTSDSAQAAAKAFTSGHGFDAVLITADTLGNEPVRLAGEIARSRGIVVAVGAVGMDIPRKIYYDKELSFRLSRSYGPGRYDSEYEEKGNDYPYDYVRWTEQRNLEAFLRLLGDGKIAVRPLITHRFALEDAARAYDLITGKTSEPFLGVVLKYPEPRSLDNAITLRSVAVQGTSPRTDRLGVGVLGAGNFATATLLPTLKKLERLELVGIASAGGMSAQHAAQRFGFSYCTTSTDKIFEDNRINLVAILTRHDQHASQVIAALRAGKHVYVEKPLCLTSGELDEIVATYGQRPEGTSLMVGFNRRFAPFVTELKHCLEQVHEPLLLHYRVNAGFIPKEHWTQDATQGGGRLLGEGCHFLDLLVHLAGAKPVRVTAHALPDAGYYSQDNFVVTLEFENGSIGTLTYASNGDKSFGKELLEVFGGGLSARIDNYRTLLIRHNRTKIQRTARLRQNKGYDQEWKAFAAHLRGESPAPIAFADTVCSMEVTLAAKQSLLTGEPVALVRPSTPPEAKR